MRGTVASFDEIPGACDDTDRVMANREDLAEVVHPLKRVAGVKAE